MKNELPEWRPLDTIKSIVGIVETGYHAGKVAVANIIEKADTWLADYGGDELD